MDNYKVIKRVYDSNGAVTVLSVQARSGEVYTAFKYGGDKWTIARYKTSASNEGFILAGCEALKDYEMLLKFEEFCK